MHFVCDLFCRLIPMVDYLLRLEGSNFLKHSVFKKQSSDTYISVGKAASFLTNKTCQRDIDNVSNSWHEYSVEVQFHSIPLEL
jgi:hypothetical protein